MDMTGEERIPASREAVWAALNNPNILKRCIPGCDSLEMTSPTEMKALVKIKIGPVSASFKGQVTLTELNPPESYVIIGEGSGGIAGFAKGSSAVKLTADGDATILSYTVKAQIGGKLAMLGSRMIDGASKKLAGQFFTKFNKILTKKAGANASEDLGDDADDDTNEEA